jgi:putative FmdB family regulatory protein
MPLFEYQCPDCQQQFEKLQRSVDAAVECPFCGQPNPRRLISLCGVSSDTSRAANLSAAHRRAAAKRTDRNKAEHAAHHSHFGDAAK